MACYNWGSEDPDSLLLGKFLGGYITCVLGPIWNTAQIIIIAVAIILVILLIYKTVTNRENVKVLEELPKQWIYAILLALVAIGGGGTILNIMLKFFGFGSVQDWLNVLNDFFEGL